jgi:hypothetical protein
MGGIEVYNTETWEMSALFQTSNYAEAFPDEGVPYTAVRSQISYCQMAALLKSLKAW